VTDVVSVVEGLDLVVGMAEGHLHPDDLATARRAARSARLRVGHLGATLVTALVGGTGAGKSSLLNALAGNRIASTSAVRPHTTEPLAWVPEDAEPRLRALLDSLGVTSIIPQSRFPGLAILDMTDVDSLESAHRMRVEELLPSIDVAIWVLDPLKYADALLHKAFIAPAAESSDRLIFVLNQIDTIPPDERAMLRDHLIEVLRADGIAVPRVFEVAAAPPDGKRLGVDALSNYLRARLDEKRVHLGRVIEDARRAARAVAGAAGVAGGGSLDFEQRWADFRSRTVAALAAGGPSVSVYEEALRSLEQLILRLSAIAGGPFGMRVRMTFSPERLDDELRGAIDVMEAVVPRLPGKDGRPGPIDPRRRAEAADVLDAQLQARIGAPLREIVWERASLAATVAGLAVDASMAESHLGIVKEAG
jgi:energy-coupling factor transporter ATP-binding protein EcfA2